MSVHDPKRNSWRQSLIVFYQRRLMPITGPMLDKIETVLSEAVILL